MRTDEAFTNRLKHDRQAWESRFLKRTCTAIFQVNFPRKPKRVALLREFTHREENARRRVASINHLNSVDQRLSDRASSSKRSRETGTGYRGKLKWKTQRTNGYRFIKVPWLPTESIFVMVHGIALDAAENM